MKKVKIALPRANRSADSHSSLGLVWYLLFIFVLQHISPRSIVIITIQCSTWDTSLNPRIERKSRALELDVWLGGLLVSDFYFCLFNILFSSPMIVGARQRSVSLCAPQWPRLATTTDQPIIVIVIVIITIIDMFVITISVVVEALG